MSSSRQGAPLIAYSLSPERNRVRVMVSSARSVASLPARLSMVRLTSARPSAGRCELPAKMTSSIFAEPQRARPLGAEHPRHCVDHVRFAAAVRPHHDGDPGLEFEHGRVGKRLETFECQRLQEHRPLTLPGGVLQREVLRPEPRSPRSDLAVLAEERRAPSGLDAHDGRSAAAAGLALTVVGLVLVLVVADLPEEVAVLLVRQRGAAPLDRFGQRLDHRPVETPHLLGGERVRRPGRSEGRRRRGSRPRTCCRCPRRTPGP